MIVTTSLPLTNTPDPEAGLKLPRGQRALQAFNVIKKFRAAKHRN
jgi:hypothetical protein